MASYQPTALPSAVRTPPPSTHPTFPGETKPAKGVREFTHRGWTVSTSQQPILPEAEIEHLAHKFQIEMPTMSFGHNHVQVRHGGSSGWQLSFTMLGALDAVDKTASKMLKVAHSDSWQQSRQKYAGDILEVVKPFDWSFTTDYKGIVERADEGTENSTKASVEGDSKSRFRYNLPGFVATDSVAPPAGSKPLSPASPSVETIREDEPAEAKDEAPSSSSSEKKPETTADLPQFSPSDDPLPLDRLRRPDPILFFDDVSLFEDELADNGLAQLSVKIRVMPDRLFVLQRFYLRLTNVIFRLRDTRVCVEFGTGEVWREYTAREAEWKTVADRLMASGRHLNSVIQATWNPDNLLREGLLPEVETVLEKVTVV